MIDSLKITIYDNEVTLIRLFSMRPFLPFVEGSDVIFDTMYVFTRHKEKSKT